VRPVPNFVAVTDAIMRAPKPEDWLMYRGNYAGWAYSPLDKINKTNVKNLQLVWSRAMAPGANEITPIIYNGVMYIANPNATRSRPSSTTASCTSPIRTM
jgi:alcohol dehydrogenase (cytochrome c)